MAASAADRQTRDDRGIVPPCSARMRCARAAPARLQDKHRTGRGENHASVKAPDRGRRAKPILGIRTFGRNTPRLNPIYGQVRHARVAERHGPPAIRTPTDLISPLRLDWLTAKPASDSIRRTSCEDHLS